MARSRYGALLLLCQQGGYLGDKLGRLGEGHSKEYLLICQAWVLLEDRWKHLRQGTIVQGGRVTQVGEAVYEWYVDYACFLQDPAPEFKVDTVFFSVH